MTIPVKIFRTFSLLGVWIQLGLWLPLKQRWERGKGNDLERVESIGGPSCCTLHFPIKDVKGGGGRGDGGGRLTAWRTKWLTNARSTKGATNDTKSWLWKAFIQSNQSQLLCELFVISPFLLVLQLNFIGVTVDPDSYYVHFANTKHMFEPVPIGSTSPPVQVYELYNGGAQTVKYELDLEPLAQVEAVSCSLATRPISSNWGRRKKQEIPGGKVRLG